MKYDDFAQFVKERTRFRSDEDANRAISSVIELLGQRISSSQAVDIAAALPPEVRPYLMQRVQTPEAEPFALEKFLSAVGERTGVDRAAAGEQARAVLSVVGEWLPREELRDTLAQLPNEMRGFFEWMKKAA
ncbi:MAG: hypothetical protein A2010_16545 [Nitrospirae bacterium GWD2_57_9]|nr:MAG: hypothetical protein A2010_16545 [Nitrospirae bacterium GWD2_57_9]OGW48456.1 MAG: hypothetical protein A2078_10025 [Nitrospirae bacterium GWC2_57_9]